MSTTSSRPLAFLSWSFFAVLSAAATFTGRAASQSGKGSDCTHERLSAGEANGFVCNAPRGAEASTDVKRGMCPVGCELEVSETDKGVSLSCSCEPAN